MNSSPARLIELMLERTRQQAGAGALYFASRGGPGRPPRPSGGAWRRPRSRAPDRHPSWSDPYRPPARSAGLTSSMQSDPSTSTTANVAGPRPAAAPRGPRRERARIVSVRSSSSSWRHEPNESIHGPGLRAQARVTEGEDGPEGHGGKDSRGVPASRGPVRIRRPAVAGLGPGPGGALVADSETTRVVHVLINHGDGGAPSSSPTVAPRSTTWKRHRPARRAT